MSWSNILDQAGNIAIGLLLLFIGVPIIVWLLTLLGKLLVNLIAWPIGLTIVGLQKLYKWLVTPSNIKSAAPELPPGASQAVSIAPVRPTAQQDTETEIETEIEPASYTPPELNRFKGKAFNQLPFDQGEVFTGEIIGKRLRLVCGIQTLGKQYRSENKADKFWLAFEADNPAELIWVSPQWRYLGANFGFQMLPEALKVAAGKLPFKLESTESIIALAQWQALQGLPLFKVTTNSPINAPLALIFDADETVNRPAHIGFDTEDLDEPFLIGMGGLSGSAGHWALTDEVQFYLNLQNPFWTSPRNTPEHPWNNQHHLDALIQLRRLLQDTVIWLSTQVFLAVPLRDIEGYLNDMWMALDELSAFEIAVMRRKHLVRNNPSWLDRDGETVDEAWESMTAFEVQLMAVELRESMALWQGTMAASVWQNEFIRHEDLIVSVISNSLIFSEISEISTQLSECMKTLADAFLGWSKWLCWGVGIYRTPVKQVILDTAEPQNFMLPIEFIDDASASFGFLVVPKDKSSFKETQACIHLDTSYVRMSISVLDRYIMYLFDKNKQQVTWYQRAAEIEHLPIEEKDFGDGYKVERRREVKFFPESFADGREFLVDELKFHDVSQTTKSYIEITPIEKIYEEYLEHIKSRKDFDLRRATNQQKYLNSETIASQRRDILFEEVACEVAMFTYHPTFREGDNMAVFAEYETYLGKYFSKVEHPEDTYIDYLQAYCYGLRESAAGDLEGDDEIEFIKNKCKEAELLQIFYKRFSNLKKS